MPAPIELALSTLLPTTSFLQPDLISLASSLLAQSRAKASSLKQEEEIARTYACAHIACQRLQKRLDLEIGKARPPVKPKVYEKLFKYLDGVLTVQAAGGRTPVKRKEAETPRKGAVQTPKSGRKRAHDEEVVGLEEQSTAKKVKQSGQQEEEDVPDFVMTMIRAICKATNLPVAVPHVRVGAGAVVQEITSRNQKRPSSSRGRTRTPQSARSAAPSEKGSLATARWPALVLALFCLTAARLQDLENDDEKREVGIEAVKSFCEDQAASLPEGTNARLESVATDIDFYMLEAEDCGWLEMDWYQNVPKGAIDPHREDEVMEDVNEQEAVTPKRNKKAPHKTPLQRKEKHGGKVADGLDDDLGAAGLLPGLGTMFQPAVDWLSDERRADYTQWRRGIMKEIAAIEQEA